MIGAEDHNDEEATPAEMRSVVLTVISILTFFGALVSLGVVIAL